MKELINSQIHIERLAFEMYQKAADVFKDDLVFSRFLEESAIEEKWHEKILLDSLNYYESNPIDHPSFTIDPVLDLETRSFIEDIMSGLEKKELSRVQLLEHIIELESSEWNDTFLYIVNMITKKNIKNILPRLQSHIEAIDLFIEKNIDADSLSNKLKSFPKVWRENILIVDDEEMVAELIESLLSARGNIYHAENGEKAMNLLNQKYYKLIITDVDMPVADGISFYKKAEKKYTDIGKRFLFLSGNFSKENIIFFKQKNLKYFEKPMNINTLYKVSRSMLLSS